jgi:alpha-tubulin suppressor-like RCC1 family protein
VDSDAAKVSGLSPGEAGVKAFTWGVGSLLGIGNANVQGMASAQRVAALKAPVTPLMLSGGPEHAAALAQDGALFVWGSNEFRQVAAPPDMPVAFRPIQLSALATRKVLSIACGGSHTLAVVSDGASAAGGVLVGWGTGTVGQLGLGESCQYADGPVVVTLPTTTNSKGKPVPVARAFAGLVSSAATTVLGDCFVWGDASVGRLGLSSVPDTSAPGSVPMLVNAAKVWTPQQLVFNPSDLGPEESAKGTKPTVVGVCLGGSFSLFLLHGSNPNASGCVLLASGALGVDITRDTYGHVTVTGGATVDSQIDEEIRTISRRHTPVPLAPFGTRPIVLSAYAGARHAAVIVADDTRGNAPRLFTAGKGWLGHKGEAETLLLKRPAVSSFFAPVAGALADEDIVEAACGHSHTVARTSDGRLFAWGRGDSGEIGQGNLTDRSLPVACKPAEGHKWTQVCAGSYYSMALCEPGYGVRPAVSEILSGFQGKWTKQQADEAAAQAAISSTNHSAHVASAASLPAATAAVAPVTQAASGGSLPVPVGKASVATVAAPEPEPEPAAAEAAPAEEPYDPLPDGWDYDYDDEGNIYFIRPDGNTQWEDPRETPA